MSYQDELKSKYWDEKRVRIIKQQKKCQSAEYGTIFNFIIKDMLSPEKLGNIQTTISFCYVGNVMNLLMGMKKYYFSPVPGNLFIVTNLFTDARDVMGSGQLIGIGIIWMGFVLLVMGRDFSLETGTNMKSINGN